MARATSNSIPATDQPLDRACAEIFRVWSIYLPEADAREQSDNFKKSVTGTNTGFNALLEFQTGRQLQEAGLRLERSPRHLPRGYRLYDGHQIIAGHD
jgi:hypothetical protein